jgi:hypothetical protein
VQANRQIAELAVQLARQRVTVKHALDTGQHSEMAESLLIPNPIDQNPWAHWRSPMDMMRQG